MISGRMRCFRVPYEEKNASRQIKKPRNPSMTSCCSYVKYSTFIETKYLYIQQFL